MRDQFARSTSAKPRRKGRFTHKRGQGMSVDPVDKAASRMLRIRLRATREQVEMLDRMEEPAEVE